MDDIIAYLWGKKARARHLIIAAGILLLSFLSGRELWTQEHRWAEVVAAMFYFHDYLHPYVGDLAYYDKPLLSYWLIVLFSKTAGALTLWTLRLPSVFAGFLALFSIYQLGCQLKNKSFGFLSTWLLLSTFYFIFWARISSTEMLNLAGTLFAISWYVSKREAPNFFNYFCFFLILALTSLCKGLCGAIIPAIAVFIDIVLRKTWRTHFNKSIIPAIVLSALIYFLPFSLSEYFNNHDYPVRGLEFVYRENILRYFEPFDHQEPFYIYFLYLPIYILPWTIFLIPVFYNAITRYSLLNINTKWILWTGISLFLFFTLGGSRRNYYILPIVPYAILLIADWLMHASNRIRRERLIAGMLILSYLFIFILIDILPSYYYSQFGAERFSEKLMHEASKIKPWKNWNVVLLDGDSKLIFYLHLPPQTKNYSFKNNNSMLCMKDCITLSALLNKRNAETIYISRKIYLNDLKNFFPHYKMVTPTHPYPSKFLFSMKENLDTPVAFMPK